MKLVRCEFNGHFYMEIKDNATPDDIENCLELYINNLEHNMEPVAAIDEYDWNEILDINV